MKPEARSPEAIAQTEPVGETSISMTFAELVFSDLRALRPGAPARWSAVIIRLHVLPGLLASLLLRGQQCLFRSGRVRRANALRTLGNVLIGADLGGGMVVGPGLALQHPVGLVMGIGARVGANVTLAGGVTMAARYYDSPAGEAQQFPIVEDDAVIGAHAVLVGGVRIGRGAVVGANTVVLSDVAAGTVVFGVPARRVGVRGNTV